MDYAPYNAPTISLEEVLTPQGEYRNKRVEYNHYQAPTFSLQEAFTPQVESIQKLTSTTVPQIIVKLYLLRARWLTELC